MSLLEGTNSPHFHNESIKTHSPLVKLSCGPGSEISFAPFNLNNNTHSRNNTNSLSNCASIQSISPNQKLVLSGELFFDKQIIINTKGFSPSVFIRISISFLDIPPFNIAKYLAYTGCLQRGIVTS